MNAITYKYFTEEQVKELDESRGYTDKIRKLIRDILFKNDISEESKNAIESFQFYSFAFAKNSNFDTKKTACYMSIIQEMLLHDIDEKMESVESSMKHFKELILRHSTERPPVSVGIFSSEDASNLAQDASSRYYRHFNMYKNIFVVEEDNFDDCKDDEE